MHHAVKWRLIALNPADACEAPRPDKTEMEVFNAEEVRQLLTLIRDHEDEAIIKTALFTGMRQGELLGLRWRDVDLDQKVLHVQQTVGRLPKVGFVFRPCPKNKRSRRLIALPEIVISALKKHKKLKATEELKAEKYAEHNLVFCTPAGEPLDPSALGRRFKALAQQMHRPKMRFHDLRHTHATMLFSQGVHPKIVQERLGHETISITLDTYSHVQPGMQEEAVARLENLFKK
ncbi:MAG: site-specific integrase [Bacillota bacterium]